MTNTGNRKIPNMVATNERERKREALNLGRTAGSDHSGLIQNSGLHAQKVGKHSKSYTRVHTNVYVCV